MSTQPMFLNLLQIRFPITAIVSILHRISGVVLFMAIPGMLWVLERSLISINSFNSLKITLASLGGKCGMTIVLLALSYHIIAGTRHLIMDLGYGESKCAGKMTSIVVLAAFILSAIYIGFVIW